MIRIEITAHFFGLRVMHVVYDYADKSVLLWYFGFVLNLILRTNCYIYMHTEICVISIQKDAAYVSHALFFEIAFVRCKLDGMI